MLVPIRIELLMLRIKLLMFRIELLMDPGPVRVRLTCDEDRVVGPVLAPHPDC